MTCQRYSVPPPRVKPDTRTVIERPDRTSSRASRSARRCSSRPTSAVAFEPSQAGASDECMKGFLPLREDAEKRGKMIKVASDRHAPPDEACKLIGNFGQAEVKMIKYVEANAAKCGIPPQIPEQLKNGHKNTEMMLKRVCDAAAQGGCET